MSQTSITSYFNSRKRAAPDDIITSKNKIPHIDRTQESYRVSRKAQIKNCEVQDEVKPIVSANEVELGEGKKIENVLKETDDRRNAVEPNVAKSVPEDEPRQTVFERKKNSGNIAKTGEPSSKAGGVASARKELSLGDIRKKLAGSSRLAEIKAAADRLSKGIQKLKESSDKKNLKEFKYLDVEVPSSPRKNSQSENELLSPTQEASVSTKLPLISPRKVFVSPVKSPNKLPAYIRYAAISTDSTSLPLPYHYRFLSEIFRGMETVVSLLYNRNEKVTFAKLKPSVQEMLKRTFTEKHLAQIKTLVPEFYNFEVQKIKNFSASSHKETYEMVITPNLPKDINTMNPTVLLERRKYFQDALMKLAKRLHNQYLLSLNPPMVIPDDKLARWHPCFEVDKLPEIESAKLPAMPNVEKFSSAQDVLSKARELFKCNTKMEKALEKLAQAKARGLTEAEKIATGFCEDGPSSSTNGTQAVPSISNIQILNPALRNLPASLLEKVKAKQAAKALEAMTRSADQENKYSVYSRLPDLARTLRNIFVTERKNVLALNIILSKLDSNFKAHISANDVQKDIVALAEAMPEFVKLHEIRNNTYLKLDKNANLNKITCRLNVLAAKYKKD